ncbi:MAG: diguanylate cyclase [Acidobacteriota bacterium]
MVDDDQGYLQFIRFALTRAGFDVFLASDGASAIARIREGRDIDLLILDLSMPGMDGFETMQKIHAEQHLPGLYTILLTAHSETPTKLRALEGGFDDYITKNAPESEIVAKLRSAARRLEMERRLQLQNAELQSLALTDELTGIANRRALFREGEHLLASDRKLSAVLFDLDDFKLINDNYGHVAGDRILADVAAAFQEHTRYGDIIARYGGDEFVMLLPDTAADETVVIAERLMEKIRRLQWTMNGGVVRVGATFGVAERSPDCNTLPELLICCDRGMYKLKKQDRPAIQP